MTFRDSLPHHALLIGLGLASYACGSSEPAGTGTGSGGSGAVGPSAGGTAGTGGRGAGGSTAGMPGTGGASGMPTTTTGGTGATAGGSTGGTGVVAGSGPGGGAPNRRQRKRRSRRQTRRRGSTERRGAESPAAARGTSGGGPCRAAARGKVAGRPAQRPREALPQAAAQPIRRRPVEPREPLAASTSPARLAPITCSCRRTTTRPRRARLIFQFHPWGGTARASPDDVRTELGDTGRDLRDAARVGRGQQRGPAGRTRTAWTLRSPKRCSTTSKGSTASTTPGFSRSASATAGMMSFAVGCEMSNVFRAIAPMSGALYSDPSCPGTGPHVAMWGSHGTSDTVVPIDNGRAARDKILQQNHCGTTTTPVDPSPCVKYDGCDAGYDVTWCEWDGAARHSELRQQRHYRVP